jgi:hypothetical protein
LEQAARARLRLKQALQDGLAVLLLGEFNRELLKSRLEVVLAVRAPKAAAAVAAAAMAPADVPPIERKR